MTLSKKRGFLPQLRFLEFREAGEWEKKRLGDVGSVRMCKRILKEQTSPRGDIPFYKIGTFGGVPDAYISREIFENFRNGYPFPKNGAVLISAAGTIGRTVRYNGELAYFQDSNIVWLDNSEKLITDNFLFYLYQLIDWSPSVGAIQRLYNENILGAQVNFPSIPEQQKIADSLASLDELITLEAQKLDMLKTHKKGLMQQLFPAEGETLPKLRFSEFRGAGEWENKKLSSLIQLISGLHLSPDQYSNSGTTPYFTGPSDFTNGIQNVSKWTEESTSIARENDILITVKGNGVGEIFFLALQSVAMGRQLMAIRSKNGSSRFFYQFLLTKRTRFEDLASGNLIPGLSRGAIIDLEAHFPSLPEQQKIADCLTSLDDLITAQTQKLAALKIHKKGLMQQLFPILEEVEA